MSLRCTIWPARSLRQSLPSAAHPRTAAGTATGAHALLKRGGAGVGGDTCCNGCSRVRVPQLDPARAERGLRQERLVLVVTLRARLAAQRFEQVCTAANEGADGGDGGQFGAIIESLRSLRAAHTIRSPSEWGRRGPPGRPGALATRRAGSAAAGWCTQEASAPEQAHGHSVARHHLVGRDAASALCTSHPRCLRPPHP